MFEIEGGDLSHSSSVAAQGSFAPLQNVAVSSRGSVKATLVLLRHTARPELFIHNTVRSYL
jgi:hypothetical protein